MRRAAKLDSKRSTAWIATLPRGRGLALACVLAGALVGGGSLGLSPWRAPAALGGEADPLAPLVEAAGDDAEPGAIRALLEKGRELGRPGEAYYAARKWLQTNAAKDPALLRMAGENAFLAADYKGAVGFLKSYLDQAKPGAEAAASYALLLSVMVDVQGDQDAAYQFMSATGGAFRTTPNAKSYDPWYLRQARRREDAKGAAERLLLVCDGSLPLPVEQRYAWDTVDWLIERATKRPWECKDGAKAIGALVGKIRDKKRQAALRFLGENIAYIAAVDDSQKPKIDGLVQAAKAYIDADGTPEAVKVVYAGFAGGWDRFEDKYFKDQPKAKHGVFLHAWGKLNEDDRVELIRWNHHNRDMARYYLDAEAWGKVVQKDPGFFAKDAIPYELPLFVKDQKDEAYKKLAGALEKCRAKDAALVRAMAVDGDFMPKAKQFLGKETWRLEPWHVEDLLKEAFSTYNKARGQKDDWDHFDKAITQPNASLAQTPAVLFDQGAREMFYDAVWDQGDRSRIPELLRQMDWVPMNDKDRKRAVDRGYGDFKNWAGWVRKELKKGDKGDKRITPAMGQEIAALDAAWKRAFDEKSFNPAAAASGALTALAQAVSAANGKDSKAYSEAARAAYKTLKKRDRSVPCGEQSLDWLLRNHRDIDAFPFQLEVLQDALATATPDGPNVYLRRVSKRLTDDLRDWRDNWYNKDKGRSLEAEPLFRETLAAQVKQGAMWPPLFDWWRNVRRFDKKRGDELMAQIIDKGILQKHYRSKGRGKSATMALMWIVDREFPGLKDRLDSGFEEAMIAEARETKFVDHDYWRFGKDKEKKVITVAAEVFPAAPVFAPDGERLYDWDKSWNLAKRIENDAPKAARVACFQAFGQAYGASDLGWEGASAPVLTQDFNLGKTEGRGAFFQALAQVNGRIAAQPIRTFVFLEDVEVDDIDAERDVPAGALDPLVALFTTNAPDGTPREGRYHELTRLALKALAKEKRWTDLHACAPTFWRVAYDYGDEGLMRDLGAFASEMAEDGNKSLAATLSGAGLMVAKDRLPDDTRNQLAAIESRTSLSVGGRIPVPRTDPRYPVYESQAAYAAGSEQSAWRSYLDNAAKVPEMIKELSPGYITWLIQENARTQRLDAAEALARAMLTWVSQAPEGFSDEDRAALQIAYGDIHFNRGALPVARAQYSRVAAAEEFAETRGQLEAQLRIAEVDRLTRQFDAAMRTLEKLVKKRDRGIQADAFYQMSQVKYDQEEYKEANEYLEQVFLRAPDHPLGRILRARLQLKMKDIMGATQVEIGISASQRILVPGQTLKVNLEDRNLSVAGRATAIEVRAWTESGDEEFIIMRPFGDSKTKFHGELPTALGAAQPDDKTLQFVGDDKIWYAYSDRFAKAHNLEVTPTGPLTVAADAELYASSGQILSKAEREARALEEMIRKQLALKAEEGDQVALSDRRSGDQIKPGNSINIRVLDPERSATAEADTIFVAVETTSGDSIAKFPLRETDAVSGAFEGSVPTASAQATAFASDSNTGSQPNFAISSGDHPAWVALPDNKRPKTFSVDLNDNVPLGELKIIATEEGRKLKRFLVQTSLNGTSFKTYARYPDALRPWDGKPRATLVKYRNGKKYAPSDRSRGGANPYARYLEYGYYSEGFTKGAQSLATLARKRDKKADEDLRRDAGGRWDWNEEAILHGEAFFFVPQRTGRQFRLAFDQKRLREGKRRGSDGFEALFLLDGQPAEWSKRGENDPYTIRRALGPGIHKLDVLFVGRYRDLPSWRVLCDDSAANELVDCPPAMFDPAKTPELKDAPIPRPTKVEGGGDGGVFTFTFPKHVNARMVRLVLADFETDAPAINKVALTTADGKSILPTAEDFLALRKNQTLEIVPGDRITVKYEDPRFVTPGHEIHETFLNATFTNAKLAATTVEYNTDHKGNRLARYIPLRRFRPGDRIDIFVNDPDMDVSEGADKVAFVAKTTTGSPVTIAALETGEHTGVFTGAIFPVAGPAQKKTELPIKPGEEILITYRDEDNLDPGVPWDRTTSIEQAVYRTPVLSIYSASSAEIAKPKEGEGGKDAPAGKSQAQQDAEMATGELVPIRRNLIYTYPDEAGREKPATGIVGAPVMLDVVAPHLALTAESTVTVYLQTESGRKKVAELAAAEGEAGEGMEAGSEAGGEAGAAVEFDPTVPGTMVFKVRASSGGRATPPPGYGTVLVRAPQTGNDAMTDGRFTVVAPIELGEVPEESFVPDPTDPTAAEDEEVPTALIVTGDDTIHVAYQFEDKAGNAQWAMGKVKLGSDAFFDVMDVRYAETVDGAYVGEKLYFRVHHTSRDESPEKDQVQIKLRASSGAELELPLTETFETTGVFKGVVELAYAEEKSATPAGDGEGADGEGAEGEPVAAITKSVAASALPVKYGDTVTAVYTDPTTGGELSHRVLVHKGADGKILPFTKRFEDPQMAVQTMFAMAESYFELAKKHRKLKDESTARRELQQAKRILGEALKTYHEDSIRAQAEYLLGNLAQEYADITPNSAAKEKLYQEALDRFTQIPGRYPDSPYAAKSQFKKALVYEKMGQIEIAAEEYVKLSYKYPDNEHVPDTMARLGAFFNKKGKRLMLKAKQMEDPVEAEKVRMEGRQQFVTAADVFYRLRQRFADHPLADKAALISGRSFLQAEKYDQGVKRLEEVAADSKAEASVRAEALYWSGWAYERSEKLQHAFAAYKRITWDYPETKWAKFARGRLADPAIIKANP